MGKIWQMLLLVMLYFVKVVHSVTLNTNLTNLMSTRIEKYAKEMVAAMEKSWNDLCSYDCKCSFHSCAIPLALGCNERWSKPACTTCGSRVNTSFSDLAVGNRFYLVDVEVPEAKETICAGATMDSYWYPILQNETMIVRSYFGDYMGVLRNYPAEPLCFIYDDRYRPWFVAAAAGVKDVMVIIDTSENTNETVLNTTKTVANLILSTLTFNDYAAIVTIGNDDRLFSPYLVRANYANVGYMTNFINSLKINGTSNYETTLNTTYNIIDRSLDTNRTSNCQQVIFWISAGPPKGGETNTTKLLNFMKSYNENIFYFTYSIGDVEDPFLQAMACEFNGVHEHINVTDYFPSLESFFQVLNTFIAEPKITYAEPYTDAMGSGYITTASIVVYDYTQDPPFMLGVFGFDILMSTLLEMGRIDQIYVAFQVIGSASCSKATLTPCQTESIRPDKFKCGVTDTSCKPYKKTMRKCPNMKFPSTILCNPDVQTKLQECCDHDICSVDYIYALSIIFGLFAIVGIILLCVYFCCRSIWDKIFKRNPRRNNSTMNMDDISQQGDRSENIGGKYSVNNYLGLSGISKNNCLRDLEK